MEYHTCIHEEAYTEIVGSIERVIPREVMLQLHCSLRQLTVLYPASDSI